MAAGLEHPHIGLFFGGNDPVSGILNLISHLQVGVNDVGLPADQGRNPGAG